MTRERTRGTPETLTRRSLRTESSLHTRRGVGATLEGGVIAFDQSHQLVRHHWIAFCHNGGKLILAKILNKIQILLQILQVTLEVLLWFVIQ